MKKKLLAFLLAALFIAGIASGCSNNAAEPSDKPASNPTSTPAQPDGQEPDKTPAGEGGLKLPIVDEKIEVTAFWPVNDFQSQVTTSLNDLIAFKELENRTNIHVSYESPPYGEEQTTFNLMVVSGDINDILNVPNLETWYAGGVTQAVADEVVADLTDLIPQYAVNAWAELNKNEQRIKEARDDSGRIYGMPGISTRGAEPAWGGLVIRKDLLDEQGVALPVTIAEWDNALTIFKDVYGAEAPLIMHNNSGYFWSGEFASAYDAHYTFQQVDGKVEYGPITDGWKTYIELMRDWYSRGLLDRDFTSRDVGADFWRKGLLGTGKACAGWNAWGNVADRLYQDGVTDNPNFYLAAINNPRRQADIPTHIRITNTEVLTSVYVSAESKYIPEVVKWLDYFYTKEGLLLNNYGIEGESYKMVNGEPVLTEMLLDSSEGAWELNLAKWTLYQGPGFYDYKRNWQAYDPELISACDVWDADDDSWVIPSKITRTPDENTEFSNIMSEVETYVFEMTCRMIVGDLSLDEWDTYIKTVNNMNIARAIEIQQNALDRYNAR